MGFENQRRQRAHHVCPWWLCFTFDNALRRLVHDPERLLAPYVRPGMTACDIGCGMGHFTIGLARLAGPEGKVTACDLQPQMLAVLEKRARKAGVANRITTHLAQPDRLGSVEPADFALAFWMAHEVPDKDRFFGEIFHLLKVGGRFLLCEPKMHVTGAAFAETAALCRAEGFVTEGAPAIPLSRALVMVKETHEDPILRVQPA
jgi:ubiquinone/menaquinone biosynthesis C-methylase UbiE